MKFKFVFVDKRELVETAEMTVPLFRSICGMQLRGIRPQTVELTRKELASLLHNPEYAMVVLATLSHKETEFQNLKEEVA